jgi:predicted nucleic acid-binding protein
LSKGRFSPTLGFVRIYLDACCLNRPFDDQSQVRVHLESEAVLAIIERAEDGRWTLLSSAALEFELAQTPDPERRARTLKLLSAAQQRAAVSATESARAQALRDAHGLRALDALHLACAETLRADAFLTTDDRLLRAIHRMAADTLPFAVANPLNWLTELLARE